MSTSRRSALAGGVRGWDGSVYVVEPAAPEGWLVSLAWFREARCFVVRVWGPGDEGEPRYEVGDTDSRELDTFQALLAACFACQIGPFDGIGCVDWQREAGLADDLSRLVDAGAGAAGPPRRLRWGRRSA